MVEEISNDLGNIESVLCEILKPIVDFRKLKEDVLTIKNNEVF